MKAIFALVSLLLPFALAQVDTGGCTNFACNAVQERAATCDSQQSTENSYTSCLCTDVVRVNWNRCVIGFVCAWNGTGNPDEEFCTLEFCVGKFPDSFQPQTICGFNLTSSGIPGPTPSSVSGSTVSTTSTTGATTTTADPTRTDTTTRAGPSTTAASGVASATLTTGGASTLDISIGVVAGALFFVAIAM